MTKSLSLLAATSAFAVLCACGGGAPGHIPENYTDLNGVSVTPSTLGGVSSRVNETTVEMEFLTTSGSLNHISGATTVSDGTYELTDRFGFRHDDDLSDGTTKFDVSQPDIFTDYDYVFLYGGEYQAGGQNFTTAAVAGIITSPTDVSASRSASYNGEVGVFTSQTAVTHTMTGAAQVSADFSANKVDATFSDFTAENETTGLPDTPPIDRIEVTGMTINGNVFSGGTLTTTKGGNPVDITGGVTRTETRGAFFGYDNAASAPDEVGGFIFQEGPTGFALGTFLAD
jgi:hypothetical protein